MTFQVGTPVRVSNSGSSYEGLTGCIISVDNNLSLPISVGFGNGIISYFQTQELDFLTETEYLLSSEVNAKHLKDGIASFSESSSYYDFPGGVEVRQISAHLTGFGAQALQYVARATRLDGRNKGNPIEDLTKALDFIQWEIDRLRELE